MNCFPTAKDFVLLSFADNSGAAQMRPTIHKSGPNAGVLLGEDAEWSVMGLPYLKVLLLKKNSVGIGIRYIAQASKPSSAVTYPPGA